MRLYKEYSLEDFIEQCDKKRCPRYTMYNEKTCLRDSKRNQCFEKYNRKLEKDLEKSKDLTDPLWEEVKERVRNQYGEGCHLMQSLTPQEKKTISQIGLLTHKDFKKIDGAHIIPKGPFPQHKYKVSNVILIKRLFHRRLEDNQDPLTGEYTGKERVTQWYLRIWKSSREIEKDLTWEDLQEIIVKEEKVRLED